MTRTTIARMTACYWIAAGIVAVLITASAADGEPATRNPSTLPDDAVSAIQQYDKAVERANADRDAQVAKALGILKKRLETTVAAETRKGNLDGALATKAKLEKAMGESSGQADEPAAAADPFTGTWRVNWSVGGSFEYQLSPTRASLGEGTRADQVARKGDTLLIRVAVAGGGHHVHRYRVAAPYLVCESWHDPAAFDAGATPRSVGLARRVK